MCPLFWLETTLSLGVGWISDSSNLIWPLARCQQNFLWISFHRVLELICHCANSLLSPKPLTMPDKGIYIWPVLYLSCHVFEPQSTNKPVRGDTVPASVETHVTPNDLLVKSQRTEHALYICLFVLYVTPAYFFLVCFFVFVLYTVDLPAYDESEVNSLDKSTETTRTTTKQYQSHERICIPLTECMKCT